MNKTVFFVLLFLMMVPLALGATISGCTNDGATLFCHNTTFVGNTLDTTLNISIFNAVIDGRGVDGANGGSGCLPGNGGAGTDGFIRINTSGGWIEIINSTILADGGNGGDGGLATSTCSGGTGGVGGDTSFNLTSNSYIFIQESNISSVAGSGGNGGDERNPPDGSGGNGGPGGSTNSLFVAPSLVNVTNSIINISSGSGGNGGTELNDGAGNPGSGSLSGSLEIDWLTSQTFIENSFINMSGGNGGNRGGSPSSCTPLGVNAGNGGVADNVFITIENLSQVKSSQINFVGGSAGFGGAPSCADFVADARNLSVIIKSVFNITFEDSNITVVKGKAGTRNTGPGGGGSGNNGQNFPAYINITGDKTITFFNTNYSLTKIRSTQNDASQALQESNFFADDLIIWNQSSYTHEVTYLPSGPPVSMAFKNHLLDTTRDRLGWINSTFTTNGFSGQQILCSSPELFLINTTDASFLDTTNCSTVFTSNDLALLFTDPPLVSTPTFSPDPFTEPGDLTGTTNLTTINTPNATLFFNWTVNGVNVRSVSKNGSNNTLVSDTLPFNSSIINHLDNITLTVQPEEGGVLGFEESNTTQYLDPGLNNVTIGFIPVVLEVTSTQINMTIQHPGVSVTSITGSLVYNNETKPISITPGTNSSFLKAVFTTDDIGTFQENREFFFNYTINYGSGFNITYNSSFNNQTISTIVLDECPFGDSTILNFTIKDQTDGTTIPSATLFGNFFVFTNDPQVGADFNINFGSGATQQLCANTSGTSSFNMAYSLNADANNYFPETYSVENFVYQNVSQAVDVFLLPTADGTVVTFNVFNDAFQPIDDAILKIRQFDATLGQFLLVSTASVVNGVTTAPLELFSVDYSLILERNGQEFNDYINPQKFTTTTVNLFYDLLNISLDDIFAVGQTVATLNYNEDTDQITFTWNNQEGFVVSGCVQVFEATLQGDLALVDTCGTPTSSASATIVKTVGTTPGRDYVAYGTLTASPATKILSQEIDLSDGHRLFGSTGPLMASLLIAGVSLGIFGGSSVVLVIGSLVALIGVFMLGIFSFGWPVTVGLIGLGIIIIAVMRRK